MKPKHLFLALAALLAAGGLWLARSVWRTHASHKSSLEVGFKTPDGRPKSDQMLQPPDPTRRFRDSPTEEELKPGHMLRPPDPNRRFRELTPEERVRLARQGPIGG